MFRNTVRNWQFFLRHLSCVNCHNPPILIQDRWYVYEDTEKTAGGADASLVQQSHWKKDFKGQEPGNG